jgi:hypothetical protein
MQLGPLPATGSLTKAQGEDNMQLLNAPFQWLDWEDAEAVGRGSHPIQAIYQSH